jgi:putative DNA primase/helicase
MTTIPPAEPEHLTDLGNAKRLVALHGHELRYVPAWRAWLIWTGQYWQRDETGEVMRRAKAMVMSIYTAAGYETDETKRRELTRHALRSESARALRDALEVAKSETGIPVTLEDLDRDPFALNVGNGTLDLRTATLRPHDPADLITRWIPTHYDPTAEAPTWRAFLEHIFGGRRALIAFVQRAAGYALTGDTREQVIFLFLGVGANGKSTLILTLTDLLKAYAAQMSVETILAKRQDSTAMNDMLSVAGARFVSVVEPDLGRRLAEGLVKALTGGEAVSVKKLYSDIFKVRPSFKVFLSTNHRPIIRGTDHAIWRRIRLIPFDIVIPDAEQDQALADRLRVEAPGILRWAVEGCLAWQRDGLGLPDEVRTATARYRADMDGLGEFLRERCIVEPGASVAAGDLYDAYRDWASSAGEQTVSKKALNLELTERGLRPWRTERARGWTGIRLATQVERLTDSRADGSDASSYNPPTRARGRDFTTDASARVSQGDPSADETSDMFDPPEVTR